MKNKNFKKVKNKTGLPSKLKAGVENLSGLSLNDVKVHYNSDWSVQLNTRVFSQTTEIHLASGQEKRLPHEAWHVLQQKQGKAQHPLQIREAIDINNDAGLEVEADIMGIKAAQAKSGNSKVHPAT